MPPKPRVTRIVLLPRYTALAGAASFLTRPVHVKRFGKALLTAWQSTGLGDPTSQATFTLQQSTDLSTWEDVDAAFPSSPTGEQEDTVERELDLEWVRVSVAVSGTDKGVTVWMVGDFVERSA